MVAADQRSERSDERAGPAESSDVDARTPNDDDDVHSPDDDLDPDDGHHDDDGDTSIDSASPDSELDVDTASDDQRTDRQRFVRSVSIGGVLAAIPMVAILWDFGLRPLRTATPQGVFSNFYDLQARAFMRGELAVDKGSLSIEAFVIDGQDYMYFPPFPALVRIPFLWIGGSDLDGRLTAPAILVAWFVSTVMLSLLLWRIRCIVRPAAPLGRLESWAYGAFVLTATGGSILVFVGALPWVYHEAYAWGIAAALGTAFALLGLIEQPTGRRALTTGAWTTVAILSRTTSGWACAIAILMCSAWFLFGRRGDEARSLWWPTALAGIVPLVIGGSINFAKFRHPWLFPLEEQVWTEVNQHRREALAANDGGLVGSQFFSTSLINYFRPDGIRFTSIFPWVTLPAEPARAYNGAFVDQSYRTGSVIAFMPGLFALAVTGLFLSFRRGAAAGMRWMRLPFLGMLGITTGVMFYGYLAHRYTAEFFPVLAVAGAVGTVAVAHRLDSMSRALRTATIAGVAVIVTFSVLANGAAALHASRTTTGGPQLRDYVILQDRVSGLTGGPLDGYVVQSETLPPDAPADELHIIGDCDSLYLSTGDSYEPWLPIEVRDIALRVRTLPDNEDRPETVRGTLPLFTLDGIADMDVVLERVGRTTFRIVADDGVDRIAGPFFRSPRDFEFRISVSVDLRRSRYTITGPNFWSFDRPINSHADDWVTQPTLISPAEIDDRMARAEGVEVSLDRAPTPSLCGDLRD